MEHMKYLSLALACALFVFSCNSSENGEAGADGNGEPAIYAVDEYGIPKDSMEIRRGKVGRGDFFADIMVGLGLDYGEAYNVADECDDVFDLGKIKVGNSYEAYYRPGEQKPSYWKYDYDGRSFVVISMDDSVSVRMVPKKLDIETKYAEVNIGNSLWMDVQDAGAPVALALEIADIYQWTIDFFGLQKGDSFKALYDEVSFEGEVLYIDKVRYCVFNSAGEDHYAYWYDQNDGSGNRYWNEKGESLKKAFLKAPLRFTRISSGFSYNRRHPITRKVRPHTGIDYAAPKGTPVMSIGDGVVIKRGYEGAGGNVVRIRHNSVYTTAYLHLSGYAQGLKKGMKVKQGQVIGYVGSTGMSTGPHLDFRIWKNGTPINPLKMESPSVEPVKKENMAEFMDVVSYYEDFEDQFKADAVAEEYIGLII